VKISNFRIGRYATAGTCCVVLYDSVGGSGATLNSLSLLMRGEQLPANTRWQGIPSAFIPNSEEPVLFLKANQPVRLSLTGCLFL
jgi:hypothetical protein